jgi:hypothetical protein
VHVIYDKKNRQVPAGVATARKIKYDLRFPFEKQTREPREKPEMGLRIQEDGAQRHGELKHTVF